ncbi:MAG: CHAT domain-containing protein [Bacteroidales bacterium]
MNGIFTRKLENVKYCFFLVVFVFSFYGVLFGASSLYAYKDIDDIVKEADYFSKTKRSDSALYFYKKALNKLESDTSTLNFNLYIKMVDVFRGVKKFDSAQIFLSNAKRYIKYGNIDRNKALYYFNLGKVFKGKRDYKGSVIALQKARKIFESKSVKKKNDSLLAMTLNSLGVVSAYLKDIPSAKYYYKSSIAEFIKIGKGKNLKIQGHIYANLGNLLCLDGEKEEALSMIEKSMDCYSRLKGDDKLKSYKPYKNLALILRKLGANKKSVSYFEKSVEIRKKNKGPDDIVLADLYLSLGVTLREVNEYESSLRYSREALRIYLLYNSPLDRKVAMAYNNIGVNYKKLKKGDKAIGIFQKILKANAFESDLQFQAYSNLAIGNIIKRRNDSAQYYLSLMKKRLGKNKILDITEAENRFLYAKILVFLKRYKEGKIIIEDLVEFYSNDIDLHRFELVNVILLKGNVFLSENNFDNALKEFYRAEKVLLNLNYKDTNVNLSFLLLEIYCNQFSALSKIYIENNFNEEKSKEALSKCLNCISLIDQIRNDSENNAVDDTKLRLMSENIGIYEKTVEIAYSLYEKTSDAEFLEKAFFASEKGKASVLLSAIRSIEAEKLGEVPSELLEKEKILKKAIGTLKNELYRENLLSNKNEEKVTVLRNRLFKANSSLDSLNSDFKKRYPKFFDLKYNSSVLSLKEVQKKLSSKDILLEYMFAGEYLYSFEITNKQTSLRRTSVDSIFFQKLNDLILAHRDVDFSNHKYKDFSNFIQLSTTVYQKLFQPEQDYSKKNILVIPCGKLSYLPFETLVTKLDYPKRIDYGALSYLVKKSAVSYAYSTTVLFSETSSADNPNFSLLTFAPEYGKENFLSYFPYQVRDFTKDFTPLKFTKQEVNAIHNYFEGKSFTNSDATESNFKKAASQYGILHLAMHAFIDDNDPLYSKLIFDASSDSIDDGYLNTYEVFNLKLNAKMVVLSACNTGTGKLKQGEGVMSLARSFLYAGVPDIVMTLWEVNDESGAEIMENFYENLLENKLKSEALRQAKLKYLQKSNQLKSHPFFWSAYVNIGDYRPLLNNTYQRYYVEYVALVLILITSLFLFFLLWKKKKRG